jgi:dienelactone hydrolase
MTGSGVATTYTAPATRPAADLVVSIIATSVTDPTVNASAKVTVTSGMAVTISSPSDNWQQVLPGMTQSFIATVDNDTSNAGVNWTLSCATQPCGTVSPSKTASGVATTYTPPQLANGVQLDVQLTATAVSNAAISNSLQLIAYGRFILLDGIPVTIGAGTSLQIAAEVYSDPANQNADWTLQCAASDCGSLSASTSASKAPITYTAPPAPVAADINVTVSASSVSHPDVQATATITVAALTASVDPDSALLPLNATQPFTGNLQWAATDGVHWRLNQAGAACGSACGSLSVPQTPSGEAVTYTAPAVMPSSANVSLVASAVADATKTATATVQLTNGTVKLVPNNLRLHSHYSGNQLKHKCIPGQRIATLTNVGASPLSISGITIGGTSPSLFKQRNTCLSSLGAGQSCDLTITFVCLRSGASASAVIFIADSSADSPQQLAVTGNGPPAAVSAAVRKALAAQDVLATPAPMGRQVVGTRLASLADTNYRDPYTPSGAARELMVRFWYPATLTGSCTPAPYTSPAVWSYFGTLLGVALPQVSTRSCLDASVAAGAHPVVVLTHGFTGTFTDYTYLTEDLASRGYIVASVNHTYEATATELADGRLEKSVYGSYLSRDTRYDADSVAQAISVRLQDLRFVLDKLTVLNHEAGGPFLGKLDLDRLALAGHSLGGLTTLQVLAREPRFKAGVVLDGAVTGRATPVVRQPVLALLAGDAHPDPDECRTWSALQTPPLAVRLPGVDHVALSDAAWLAGSALATGTRDPARLLSDTRRSVAAFLDATLQGSSAEHTRGKIKRSIPDVSVISGARPGCPVR